jgi:hypothetical protein
MGKTNSTVETGMRRFSPAATAPISTPALMVLAKRSADTTRTRSQRAFQAARVPAPPVHREANGMPPEVLDL